MIDKMSLRFLGRKCTIAVFVLVAVFCGIADAKPTDGIFIRGELKNLKEQVVEIIIRWRVNGVEQKDSCIVRNSKYLFATELSEPTLFTFKAKYISLDGTRFFKKVDGLTRVSNLFLDPGKTILTSIDSFENMVCKGSPSNIVYRNSLKQFISNSNLEEEARRIFYSTALSVEDSLNTIEEIRDSLSLNEDVEYFKQNSQTVLGPFILSRLYDQRYSVTELKKLFNELSDECKQYPSSQQLLKQLNSFNPLRLGQFFDWFAMPDTTGIPVNTATIGHKLLLIDFWASWCAPCRQQMQQLKEIYNNYHGKGLEVIGVSLDSKSLNWKKAIIEDQLKWINVSDLKGWNDDLVTKYYLKSIPYNILIDEKGKILATEISMEELEKKCQALKPIPK